MAGNGKAATLKILGNNLDAKAKLDEIKADADQLREDSPELKVQIDRAEAKAQMVVLKATLQREAEEDPPEILVTVEDTKALAIMEDLRGKISLLSATRATITADVDDKEAVAKLTVIDARIDELSRKTSDPRITITGTARALADIASVDLALDSLGGSKTETVSTNKKGILGGALSGLSGGLPGVGGLISDLTSKVSVLSEGGEEAGEAMGSIGASGVGIALVAVAVGALAVETGALTVGLSAAALGLGAFALLGLPTFKTILGAVGDTKAQLDKLSPPIRDAVDALKSVKSEFSTMSKAFAPQAAQLFAQAMQLVAKLMPDLLPLAKSVVPALGQAMQMISKALTGGGAQGFLKQMESLSGPVIKQVTSGIVGLLPDVRQLFSVFSKKDVLTSINIAFRLVGAALNTLTGIIKVSMGTWDELTNIVRFSMSEFDYVRHGIATFGHDVASTFDSVRGWVHSAWSDVINFFTGGWARLESDTASGIAKVEGWFKSLPGRILSAVGNLGSLLLNAGASIIHGLMTGIENAIPGLKGTLGFVTSLIPKFKGPESVDATLLRPAGRLIIGGLVGGLNDGLPALKGQLTKTTNQIGSTRVATAAAAAKGQQIEISFSADSDRVLLTALKKTVRINGGDPAVFGR